MTSFRKKLPSKETLHNLFYYENGELFYKYRDVSDFKTIADFKRSHHRVNKQVGWLSDQGYYCVIINKVQYMLHRLIFKMFHDKEPFIIDHINNCKTDNRIENLQESDRRENKIKSPEICSASGFRGVTKRKDRDSYEVKVHVISKDMHVGYYRTIEEAAAAYNLAVKFLLKDQDILFHLNDTDFPEEMVNTNKSFFKRFEQGVLKSQE